MAWKAGYIIYVDSKLCILYTIDIHHMPSKSILDRTEKVAFLCVQGLEPLHRWTGTEILGCSFTYALASIVASNMFMGSVDMMDQ